MASMSTRPGDILGYARVSTPTQNICVQVERLKAAGAIRVFEDVISGKNFSRPGLDALMEYARPNDSVYVVRLDRLGRSLKKLLDTVEPLNGRGINLVSLEEKFDITSASGELAFHLFGAIAHFERRLISERTREGIAAARARGRVPGRPPLDNGTILALRNLISEGATAGQAARQLGIGRSTAYRLARSLDLS